MNISDCSALGRIIGGIGKNGNVGIVKLRLPDFIDDVRCQFPAGDFLPGFDQVIQGNQTVCFPATESGLQGYYPVIGGFATIQPPDYLPGYTLNSCRKIGLLEKLLRIEVYLPATVEGNIAQVCRKHRFIEVTFLNIFMRPYIHKPG